jgi:hypothetical protein
MAIETIRVTCCICNVVKDDVPGVDTTYADPDLICDAIQKTMEDKGWELVKLPGNIRAFACPACLLDKCKQKTDSTLEPYNATALCPKCGHNEISTIYCELRHHTLKQGSHRAHMHRRCAKCQYEWHQRCLDDSPTTAPAA